MLFGHAYDHPVCFDYILVVCMVPDDSSSSYVHCHSHLMLGQSHIRYSDQCRSIMIRHQESIDLHWWNMISNWMIFIEPHFGSISEIWSLLIGIDQHMGSIQYVLRSWRWWVVTCVCFKPGSNPHKRYVSGPKFTPAWGETIETPICRFAVRVQLPALFNNATLCISYVSPR